MTNNILEKLKAEYTSTPSSSEENQQKKLKLTIDNNAQGQAEDYTNLLLELEEVNKKLIIKFIYLISEDLPIICLRNTHVPADAGLLLVALQYFLLNCAILQVVRSEVQIDLNDPTQEAEDRTEHGSIASGVGGRHPLAC